MLLRLTTQDKKSLTIYKLHKALEESLETSMKKLLTNPTDTRYLQGQAQVLTELVDLTKS